MGKSHPRRVNRYTMPLHLEDLDEKQNRLLERVVILDGQKCPCCGRRKPTRQIKTGTGDGAWIPKARVLFIFEEIIRRIGFEEAARQIPYSRISMRQLVYKNKPYVRRSTVTKAMHLLRELRANDVVHSKRSILHGDVARGKEPRKPEDSQDFYVRTGDSDTEYKRMQRKRDDEIERLTGY